MATQQDSQAQSSAPTPSVVTSVASTGTTCAMSKDARTFRPERLRLALIESNQSRLLKKIFLQDVRFTLAPEAAVVIKGTKLSNALLSLYSQCQVVKQKSPSLVVREKVNCTNKGAV